MKFVQQDCFTYELRYAVIDRNYIYDHCDSNLYLNQEFYLSRNEISRFLFKESNMTVSEDNYVTLNHHVLICYMKDGI